MSRLFLVAALLSASLAAAQTCPPRSVWPAAEWPERIAQTATAKAQAIGALEAFAFTLTGEDSERKGIRTDGVAIIKGGELIYERYARGYTASKRHLVWSVTKSFTNALVGRAVALGRMTLDDSVCEHIDVAADACAITVRNLLEFASGLDWDEGYEGGNNQTSSVLAMLYGEGRKDMASFVAGHRFRDPPGETFSYSSGDTVLLSGAVTGALAPQHGADFAWPLLFEPIGMSSAVLERDGRGTFVGSSYLYATPRDLARFGYLLLNDGCWNGTRLLPEGWVAASTAVSEPFKKRPLHTDPDDVQGRQFWLNQPVPEQGVPLPFPDVPPDAFFARGHWGQSISVIPSKDLVIVRVGDDREGGFDFNRFLALAIAVGEP